MLWSPFRSGRAYVRELKAFARLSRKDYVTQIDQGPDILASGYVLPGPVAQALEGWIWTECSTAPALHVLLVDRDDRSPDAHLGERLERLGSCVARVRPAGHGRDARTGSLVQGSGGRARCHHRLAERSPCLARTAAPVRQER